MINKELGTDFEQEVCSVLCYRGFWAHFIVSDKTGAQPFDIIAVKNGKPYAIDCKTCSLNKISYGRLEENQKSAFNRWIYCGNPMPLVAVQYHNEIKWVEYKALKMLGAVPLNEDKISEHPNLGQVYDENLEDFVICIL